MALKILPHGRLQEWVAEEQGYFAAEGLEYTFLPEGDYGVPAGPAKYRHQVDVRTFGTGERIVFLPYTREVFAATHLDPPRLPPSPNPPPTTRPSCPIPSPPPTDARAAPDDAAVLGFLAASSGARPWPYSGYHPGRTGGPWLCSTFVLSLFHAVVVPSGFSTSVQPLRWIATWWWNVHSSTQSAVLVGPPSALCFRTVHLARRGRAWLHPPAHRHLRAAAEPLPTSTERIKRQAVLGGLINEYERAALKPSSEPVAHL